MAFAQPAVRDNFLYNGDFYVDVGNLNRHKRASIAEITEILRPDLKKCKAMALVKDPVGHWYEAQLVHYGLPPSKDKARAKMRLLENLNKSKLKVPLSIASLEAELKKEFAAAERKAKAQHKAAMAAAVAQSTPKAAAPSKKRKASDIQETFPSINININVGSAASPVKSDQATVKKRKQQTATRGGKNHAQAGDVTSVPDTASPKPYAKQTARRGGTKSIPPPSLSHAAMQQNPSDAPLGAGALSATSSKPRAKQTARRSTSSSLSYRTPKAEPLDFPNSLQSPAKTKKTTTKQEPKAEKESKVKVERPIKKDPKVKAEPKAKMEVNTGGQSLMPQQHVPASASLGLINGMYEISCPKLEGEFGDDGFNLIFTLDTPSIWGQYDFGMFSGILHISRRPYAPSEEILEFHWRGRENSEGQMSFGDECFGGISFLGDGYIEGWINVYGECQFEGRRMEGPGTPVRSAASMRGEWDGYNEDEYERERWGGGGDVDGGESVDVGYSAGPCLLLGRGCCCD